MNTPRLCYVREPFAYFTTQPVAEQWGDDWNDAPYESNAGTPYEWREHSDGRWCSCVDPQGVTCYSGEGACGKPGHTPKPPKPRWEITKVAFEGDFETPQDGHFNSPWSVEQINSEGGPPWLRSSSYGSSEKVAIYAGETIERFIEKVRAAGGVVYEAVTQ